MSAALSHHPAARPQVAPAPAPPVEAPAALPAAPRTGLVTPAAGQCGPAQHIGAGFRSAAPHVARSTASDGAARKAGARVSDPLGVGVGSPPEAETTGRISAALGHDLSGVQVVQNDQLPATMGARAVTSGERIAFAPGEYRPETADGRLLLAHELTHVVQQSGDAPVGPQAYTGVGGDQWEREANAVSHAVLAGRRPDPVTPAPLGTPQLAPTTRQDPALAESPFAATISQEFASQSVPSGIDVKVSLSVPGFGNRPTEKQTLVMHKPVLGATTVTAYEVRLDDLYPTPEAAAEARGRRKDERHSLSLAAMTGAALAKAPPPATIPAPRPGAKPPAAGVDAAAAITSPGKVAVAGPSPADVGEVAFDLAGQRVELVARSSDFGITTEYTKISVGAASTTVLKTPSGYSLIDAGVRHDLGTKDPAAMDYVMKRLHQLNPTGVFEELLITHSHLDHVGMLETISREFVIKRISINAVQLSDWRFLKLALDLGANQRKVVEEQLRAKYRGERATWDKHPDLTELKVGPARDAHFEEWVGKQVARDLLAVKPLQVDLLTPGGTTVDAASLNLGGIDIVPKEATSPAGEGEGYKFTEYARSTLTDPAFKEQYEKLAKLREADPRAELRDEVIDKMSSAYLMKLPGGNLVGVIPDARVGDILKIQETLKVELGRLGAHVEFRVWDMTHHLHSGFVGDQVTTSAGATAAEVELAGTMRVSQLQKLTKLLTSLNAGTGGGPVDAVVVSSELSKIDPALVWLLRSCGLGVYTAHGEADVQFIEARTELGRKVAGVSQGRSHPGLRPSDPLLRRTALAVQRLEGQRAALAAEQAQRAAEAKTLVSSNRTNRTALTKQRTSLKGRLNTARRAAETPSARHAKTSQEVRDKAASDLQSAFDETDRRIKEMDAEVSAIRAQGERLAAEGQRVKAQIVDISAAERAYLAKIDTISRSIKQPEKAGIAPPEGGESPFQAEEAALDAKVRPVYAEALKTGELPAIGETSLVILGKRAQTDVGRKLEADYAKISDLQAQVTEGAPTLQTHAEFVAQVEAHVSELKGRPDAADPLVADRIEILERQKVLSQKIVDDAVASGKKVIDRDPTTGLKTETTLVATTTTEQAQQSEAAEAGEGAAERKTAAKAKGELAEKGMALFGRAMGGVMIYQEVTGTADMLARYGANQAGAAETVVGVAKSAYGVGLGYRMLTATGHVGTGKFAILSALDVTQTMLADYASTEAFNTEVTYSIVRNAVNLICAEAGMMLIATANPFGIVAGLAVMFLGERLLDWLGVHDWLAKKFDFRPDEYIDLENDLRRLVVEYSVIVGAQELSNRSDASLRGLNQYSYSNTGADFPDNVRAAAAQLTAEREQGLSRKEREILDEFSAAYSRGKQGYSQLREIDELRAQFASLFLRAHHGDSRISGPSTWGTNISSKGEMIQRSMGVVTVKEIEQRFAADEGILNQEDLSADRVPEMEQWATMDKWIGTLEGLLYQTDPGDIDWMRASEAERNLSVMVSNAHYRIDPKAQSSERVTAIIGADSPARPPYERLLAERENKLDQLRQRTVDVATGKAQPTVTIPAHEIDTEVGSYMVGPTYARPVYGDLTVQRPLSAQLTAAEQTLAGYRAQIAGMPELPDGITVEKLFSDPAVVAEYQSAATRSGGFKTALFSLRSSATATSAMVARVRQIAAKQAPDQADAARVSALVEHLRLAEQDRSVERGYLFLEELPAVSARSETSRATRMGVLFGDTQGEALSEHERAAAATNELRGFGLATLTDQLVAMKITIPDSPVEPIPGVFRLADAPSVVVSIDRRVDDEFSLTAPGGEAMVRLVPVNPAGIAYYGGRGAHWVGAWGLQPVSTNDLMAITAANRRFAAAVGQ